MYSRPPSRDPRIPPNYGGSIFSRGNTVTPVENLTRTRPPTPSDEKRLSIPEQNISDGYADDVSQNQDRSGCECAEKGEKGSLLSPLGQLGTEELLLIALALMIFQDGKDPQLGLILLALLFIN